MSDKSERKDKRKERDGSRDREKRKERDGSRDRDREKDHEKRKERDSSRDRDKAKTRHRSRSRERGRDEKRDDRDVKRQSVDKDKHKDKDKNKDKKDDRDKERRKDKTGDDKEDRNKDKTGDDKDKDKERNKDKKDDKEKEKKKKRSRSRSRKRKSRSRSKSASKKRKSRSRSKSARTRRDESEERKRLRAEEIERERSRDEFTVFVSQIHPKVDERDLFEFFSHVGKVEDIRFIRDPRSQRSKGMAYVEFWQKESITKAVSLTGQLVNNFPIIVQVTRSELNRRPTDLEDGSTMRLYFGQLHQSVSENDLRPVFEAFGPLEFVDLHKDPAGVSRGFGFVQYKKASDAKNALTALNGLEIAGKPMKVGVVDSSNENVTVLDEENFVSMSAKSRASLMAKLGRGTAMPGMDQLDAGLGLMSGLLPTPGSTSISAPMIQPTTCVVVKNMFDPKTEKEGFEKEIKEDVEEECGRFGKIKHIFVDKTSPQGLVYLRFDTVPAAQKCIKAFDGRFFASRQITADFVADSLYFLKFPKAAQ